MKNQIILTLSMVALAISLNAAQIPSGDPPATSAANKSVVSGRVNDLSTGESLAGVEVTIQGTDFKTYTDLDGNFTFSNLPTGTYNIILSLISYNKSLIDGVKVANEKTNPIEVKLISSR
ncbi:MAG: carboxypeptidase-like regulatory domain-containing protein [Bacteroidales bacterium]|nr:carboxypeptidase-like regulatory domain-containing protein [Bacteroidales bacterium]